MTNFFHPDTINNKYTVNYKSSVLALVCICFCLVPLISLQAQNQNPEFDLLLKGGHVIDPKNEIDGPMDIAVQGDKIARVAPDIPSGRAANVVDVTGLYVTPGIIDIHSHNYYGTDPYRTFSNGYLPLPPDGFTFRAGVTTVVDAGGAGWRNFQHFKDQVIDRSRTRVLAFINIVGDGMSGHAQQNIDDMNPLMTALIAGQFSEIVGVKLAHFGRPEWPVTVEKLIEAGERADMPVLIDFGPNQPSIKRLFEEFYRPGDIFTHTFHPGPEIEPVVDEEGRIKPYVREAQERGIVFDVGHGGGSFVFSHAVPAFEQGFLPNTISTDLHARSMNAGMKDMANVMSKFMAIGMSLQDVILRTTWNPAKVINRMELGHLSEGAEADIAVFNVREGDFGFVDVEGKKLQETQKLEAELTVKAGQVEWDLNGLTASMWDE